MFSTKKRALRALICLLTVFSFALQPLSACDLLQRLRRRRCNSGGGKVAAAAAMQKSPVQKSGAAMSAEPVKEEPKDEPETPPEKPAETPPEEPAEKPAEAPAEKPAEAPPEKPAEQPAPETPTETTVDEPAPPTETEPTSFITPADDDTAQTPDFSNLYAGLTKESGKADAKKPDFSHLYVGLPPAPKKDVSNYVPPTAESNDALPPGEGLFDKKPAKEKAKEGEKKDGDVQADANAFRTWVDDTGKFRVRAKLLVINEDVVRLMKENGRTTTTPLSRLSEADLRFVAEAKLNSSFASR